MGLGTISIDADRFHQLKQAYRWVPATEIERIWQMGLGADDMHFRLSSRNLQERDHAWIRRIGEKVGAAEPEPLRAAEENEND